MANYIGSSFMVNTTNNYFTTYAAYLKVMLLSQSVAPYVLSYSQILPTLALSETNFSGYARQNFVAGPIAWDPVNRQVLVTGAQVTFACTGGAPVIVDGWAVVNTLNGDVLAMGVVSPSVIMQYSTDTIKLTASVDVFEDASGSPNP